MPPPRSSQPDSNELSEVEKSVNLVAGRVRTLWLSYLLFSTYLIIAFGSVTHRMLFLNAPIKLPVLDVELPLNGFFFVAPLLYVIMHAYVLLNTSFLAARMDRYNRLIKKLGLKNKDQGQVRQRLDTFVLVQLVAGPRQNPRWPDLPLLAIALVTMAVLPVGLLVFVQVRYLPYHDSLTTWFHRGLVVADAFVVRGYWLRVSEDRPLSTPQERFGARLFATSVVVIGVFVLLVATFPGELPYRLNEVLPSKLRPVSWLFGEPTNDRNSGLFANRITVPDQDFVDDETIAAIRAREHDLDASVSIRGLTTVLSFRGRDLRGAVLDRTDLRRSDFTGANLTDASLNEAQLDGSRFDCTDRGRLLGVEEPNAEKGSRSPGCATLDNASFYRAELPGASLVRAQARGANFYRARMQGAALNAAELQGASLGRALLQGASLRSAHMQGANLNRAQMQGALLDSANLQGADLYQAQLLGASLRDADLRGASLWDAHVRGVRGIEADDVDELSTIRLLLKNALVGKLRVRSAILNQTEDPECRLFGASVSARIVDEALQGVADASVRDRIRERLAVLNPFDDVPANKAWTSLDDYQESQQADFIVELACDERNHPFVAEGLVANGLIGWLEMNRKDVAQRLLSGICRGAVDLSDQAKRKLREWTAPDAPLGAAGQVNTGKSDEDICGEVEP